ncbi:MFS transporter [Microbacterium halophytorum]|uniref:MFS transporter n=1 Tax=Microbacterium halophytorum TaxID=2067568 RepID=UPI000CFAA82E|nr:MFS transporter [Microbacterium halophytorum]
MTARRAFPWLVVAGILAVALCLRAPILGVSPVLRDIVADLGLDSTSGSMLMTVAVAMFAVATPVASLVIRRAGPELAVIVCLAGVIAGTLIRMLPSFTAMLIGMAVMGVTITIGNVVVPVIIRRDVPERHVATVTAAYAAVINVGALLVTLTTAPLAEAMGWPAALAASIVLPIAALALWIVHMLRDREPGATWAEQGVRSRHASGSGATESISLTGPVPVMGRRGGALRNPVVWLLTLTFAGQSAGYYALSTWLPAIAADLTDSSASKAGALASLFQATAIAGAFLVPLLARFFPIVVPAMTVAAGWITISLGLLLAPELYVLWASIGGVAQAGGFVVVFTVLVRAVRSDREAATASAVVQGFAYVAGTLGAPVAAFLHDATGAWTAPLVFTLALAALFTASLAAALVVLARR